MSQQLFRRVLGRHQAAQRPSLRSTKVVFNDFKIADRNDAPLEGQPRSRIDTEMDHALTRVDRRKGIGKDIGSFRVEMPHKTRIYMNKNKP